ncbi:ATP cone domain-containing protein [Flavobacterium glaciei]|uniref:Restriction endonuclease n=1 Tax=Flavobacterium glaciei TaxID=386300 RepID=A0A562PS17_9FLAO|nr:ATP cone domain-containing protein [Flavobacterium glaciei]RDI54698.1 restriction endonuclease [Flavobacterium glaciei]TWI47234.1 restriction endonuclease [Flavobacterium glaciei]
MKVIKNSGDIVEFNSDKLKKSLLKSGASAIVVDNILHVIKAQLYKGISTKQIYKMAFSLLKKTANSHAARYNLRESIRLLGPAGFFFEKYIARLFASEQYQTVTNLTLQGKCVMHEIDVLVKKKEQIAMVECKFHAGRDVASDVKVPMYILSRFNDIKERNQPVFDRKDIVSKCWIVTNNRFTADAITFAKCSGLNLLSWSYPDDNNLKTKNDLNSLYPVTCLTTLSIAEKDKLLILDVILAKEIINNSDCLNRIGLSPNRIKNVLKEVTELCSYI